MVQTTKEAGLFCVKHAYRMSKVLKDSTKHEALLEEYETRCLEIGITQDEIEAVKIEVLDELLANA